jgi:hypothetical protein
VENGNGILKTATPHPALSRKGGGKDYGNDNNHSHDNDKSFISFWIATGDKAPLAIDDHCNDHNNAKEEKRH